MGIIKGNNNNNKKIFVGYAELHPVKFNPSAEDLSEAYGKEVKTEPVYINDNGEVTLRLLAYVVHDSKKHYINIRIGTAKEEIASYVDKESGNVMKMYITPKGFAFFGVDEQSIQNSKSYSWTDTSELVEGYQGENEFYRFMIQWMRYNQNSEQNINLRKMYENVLKGDMTELNTVINDDSDEGLKGFTIPVVLTERNGYQDYYNQKYPYSNGDVKPVINNVDRRENRGKYYTGRADWSEKALRVLSVFDNEKHTTYGEYLANQSEGDSDEANVSITGGF